MASLPVRPLADPIALGTVYAFRDPSLADARGPGHANGPNYSRDGLPNVRSFERAVAELEGAEDAHATASGMAAIALVFLAQLGSGARVVVSADCYDDTRALLTEELARFGVRTAFVDATDPSSLAAALTPGTSALFVETISNPGMRLVDLPCLATMARRAGAVFCVDNTFATPALCRPLEHGADLVLHSATKFLGGHHDLTAGVVAGRHDLIGRIRRCGELFGPTLGAVDAWLALRGIKTLAPRLAWMSETAAAVAAFLAAHPLVACVRYPGLPDHPQADLARRMLPRGAGAMLAFDLGGGPPAAAALIRRLRMIPFALSLGGTSTTLCYPPRARAAGADGYASATLRMSVGLEAAADIIGDLEQALDALPVAAGSAP